MVCLLIAPSSKLSGEDPDDIEFVRVARDPDPDYLPYFFDTEVESPRDTVRQFPVNRAVQTIRVATPSDSGFYLQAYNGEFYFHNPAIYSNRIYPGNRLLDDDPVKITLHDYFTSTDAATGEPIAVGTGIYQDTAYIFKLFVNIDSTVQLPLSPGQDRNGNGYWDAQVIAMDVQDYDFDGNHEALVYINSIRDLAPRILYCIELPTMRIEWELPVAPTIQSRLAVMDPRDRENPGLIFRGYNVGQGARDQNFTDQLAYLFRVDASGEIVFKYIVAESYESHVLLDSALRQLYVVHHLWATDTTEFESGKEQQYFLSKVDFDGNLVEQARLPMVVSEMWLHRWNIDGEEEIAAQSATTAEVFFYNKELELVRHTSPTTRGRKLGVITVYGTDDRVFVFEGGLFTRKMEKLLNFDFNISFFDVFALDGDGNAEALGISVGHKWEIGKIVRRSFWDLASIFYINNKAYILTGMAALVVLLVVVNQFRRRSKKNLQIISRQKAELEEAHAELTQATETIARQRAEQAAYRQYKIASGQFRHEINNSLGSVRLYLEKLVKQLQASGGETDSVKIRSGIEAVVLPGLERSLKLADKLRRQERIQEDDTVETVSIHQVIKETLTLYEERLKRLEVEVLLRGNEDIILQGSRDLYGMVFTNLMENSLDALESITGRERRIIVSREFSSKETIRIRWYDNGVGIEKEEAENVFMPFYTTRPSGSGLGLSTVKAIVEKYGGTIHCQAEEAGVSFTIEIPVVHLQVPPDSA